MEKVYTLEDIYDLLRRKYALTWHYEVWDRTNGERRQATIEDFDYSGRYSTTDLAFYNKYGDICSLTVSVSDFEFITYRDESNVMGSGSTTYVDKDLSNEWINMLLYTHGDKYATRLLKFAQKNKQRIKDEVEQKIEKFRLKVQAEAKGPYTFYRELEQKAKSVLSVEEIAEIEQPNKSSCNENCLGIRYYDATTMTIRNTNGKDEEEVLGK